jgi:hypothetical protein
MTGVVEDSRSRWGGAWPDALAFMAGLAIAWFGGWDTKDLVWSLWLSSLMVGYAMIVWNIFGPVAQQLRQSVGGTEPPLMGQSAMNGVAGVGGLFLLAFFTFHFGMFHFVHSIFLSTFFPVTADRARGFPGPHIYWQVVKDYWPFVFVAAVAERQAFKRPVPVSAAVSTSVTATAIAARKARLGAGDNMMTPYKNVIRLHLLIFFFAFASFAKLESFWVYAVVYAVYFFPWRLLKRETVAQGG